MNWLNSEPAQPNLKQYAIGALYRFPNYATRALYLAATGKQAPIFDPSLPIKGWADPAPDGSPYLLFANGVVQSLSIPSSAASAVNLPGAYAYPQYVAQPTVAIVVGPYGGVGPVNPDELCDYADAQALAVTFSALYGKAVTVVDNTTAGIYWVEYGTETRRMWGLQVAGGPLFDFAQAFIIAQCQQYGIGSPGGWSLVSNNGNPATMIPAWTPTAQVTTAPPNALTLGVPIRALLSTEKFELVPAGNPLFEQGTWMVERTDMTTGITLAQIEQLVAQYNAQPGVTAVILTASLAG